MKALRIAYMILNRPYPRIQKGASGNLKHLFPKKQGYSHQFYNT